MRTEKLQAIQLRKSGKSDNEISRILGVPKSTLATWFRDLTLPDALLNRLYSRMRSAGTKALVARNKRQTVLAQARAHTIRQTAQAEIGAMTLDALRLLGIAFYWAEGTKRASSRSGQRVAFGNADPLAIELMMRFFRDVCRVPEEKFRACLIIAPGLNVQQAVKFWSVRTQIPQGRFITYNKLSRSSQRKRPRSRLPYGTLQIRIFDTALFHKIMGWIQGVQETSATEISPEPYRNGFNQSVLDNSTLTRFSR